MIEGFKPLLAAPVDWSKVKFDVPMTVSPKLDGIRCMVIDGVVLSRSLKPIPNKFIQARFGKPEYEGLDGELIVGPANADDVYRVTNSAVMSHDGEPDAVLHVFDHVGDMYVELSYGSRAMAVQAQCMGLPHVSIVPQIKVSDKAAVDEIEAEYLEQGYEGVMLRAWAGPNSMYKFGRGTAKACTLLKVKNFVDDDAEVIGVEELMHNGNEAVTNELGHTERSSHKENLVGGDTLGALICRTPDGIVFKIGTGFDAAMRKWLWSINPVGMIVKYKHFPIGVKQAPRFPVFIGIRSPLDMS